MKKFFYAFAAAALMVGTVACSKKDNNGADAQNGDDTTTTVTSGASADVNVALGDFATAINAASTPEELVAAYQAAAQTLQDVDPATLTAEQISALQALEGVFTQKAESLGLDMQQLTHTATAAVEEVDVEDFANGELDSVMEQVNAAVGELPEMPEMPSMEF